MADTGFPGTHPWLVRLRDPHRGVVGAGLLLDQHHLLSCAHVVANALGEPATKVAPIGELTVDLIGLASHTSRTAKVRDDGWHPDPADDVAILRLDTPLDGGLGAPLRRPRRMWDHPFSVKGFPAPFDLGVIATGRMLDRALGQWIQIEDTKVVGRFIEEGFSGAPVWDHDLEAVIGIVVAADRLPDHRTAFMIPVARLCQLWPPLERLLLRAFLNISGPDSYHGRYELSGDEFTVGRASPAGGATADALLHDPGEVIGRRHLSFVRTAGAWFVRDNQSQNGTWVITEHAGVRELTAGVPYRLAKGDIVLLRGEDEQGGITRWELQLDDTMTRARRPDDDTEPSA